MNGGSWRDGKKGRWEGKRREEVREGSREEVKFEQQKTVRIMVDQRILFKATQRNRPVGQRRRLRKTSKISTLGKQVSMIYSAEHLLNHGRGRAL